jgi:hypothetical protein
MQHITLIIVCVLSVSTAVLAQRPAGRDAPPPPPLSPGATQDDVDTA